VNISAEEKLMYEVMRAIYDSGIPVNFKGSMVLKACLMEAGYQEETRHTVDIDGNWYSKRSVTHHLPRNKCLVALLASSTLPLLGSACQPKMWETTKRMMH
jgi:hypothetical protein